MFWILVIDWGDWGTEQVEVYCSQRSNTEKTHNGHYIYIFICVCVCLYVLVAQLCLTLCNSMDCTPPGSPVHGILQARILEWVAISFSISYIYEIYIYIYRKREKEKKRCYIKFRNNTELLNVLLSVWSIKHENFSSFYFRENICNFLDWLAQHLFTFPFEVLS